jgi:hypothetical protein
MLQQTEPGGTRQLTLRLQECCRVAANDAMGQQGTRAAQHYGDGHGRRPSQSAHARLVDTSTA